MRKLALLLPLLGGCDPVTLTAVASLAATGLAAAGSTCAVLSENPDPKIAAGIKAYCKAEGARALNRELLAKAMVLAGTSAEQAEVFSKSLAVSGQVICDGR